MINTLEEDMGNESETSNILWADKYDKNSSSECDDNETDLVLPIHSHTRKNIL